MSKEYIEHEAAIDIAMQYCPDDDGVCSKADADLREMLDEIEAIPAADVRPVVRGRWKKSYADHEAFGVRPFFCYCSECHEATVYRHNYCPNCGADMRPSEEPESLTYIPPGGRSGVDNG